MSTQAVFNSKYNIVGVDPDTSGFVQIPGEAFQAPVSTDSFAKFVLIPNFPPGNADNHGNYNPTPAGQYVLGFGPCQKSRTEDNQGTPSFTYRAANIHVVTTGSYSDDMTRSIVGNQFDPYIEYNGMQGEGRPPKTSSKDRNYSTIRYHWQKMKDDGIYFPSIGRGEDLLRLEFDIQVYRNAPPVHNLGTDPKDDRYEVPAGPYSGPITIPVRVNIVELWKLGQSY